MKKCRFLAGAILILFFSFLNANDKTTLAKLRSLAIKGSPADLAEYSAYANKSANPVVMAEYAYILAHKELGEFSLYHIDRALINAPLNCGVRNYLSEILKGFGLISAADEIKGCWIDGYVKDLSLPELKLELRYKSEDEFFNEVNLLMAQKRYAEAAVRFDIYCSGKTNWRCYSGYAIALEQLGAYKSAAKAVSADIALSDNDRHKQEAELHRKELLSRKPEFYSEESNKKKMKGRYLLYLGGGADSYYGESYYNFNFRVGKFITERTDISFEAGYATGNEGLALGLVSRFNRPISDGPFRFTFAGKAERMPIEEDSFSLVISPGISYWTGVGSIDLYLDWPLTGAYKGDKVISGGYTIYF